MESLLTYDCHYYAALGLEPIPLRPGTKKAVRSYLRIPWEEQWAGIREHNIGLRLTDGPLTVLDADSLGSRVTIEAILKRLGLPHEPTVNTGGRHRGVQYWLTCYDKPADVGPRDLSPSIGDGELRAGRCYVVAPPSVVEVAYTFALNEPETHLQRRIIWEDLLTMVAPKQPSGSAVDVRWTHPEIPILTFKLTDRRIAGHTRQIELADQGDPVGDYPCRSTAMAYVVRVLLRLGWNWAGIRKHFAELAPQYLLEKGWQIQYTAAKFSADMTPPKLIQAYESVAGLTRPQDRDCYRALISEAARWNGLYAIESRTATAETTDRNLGRLMGCGPMVANRARRRLQAAGLVHVLDIGKAGDQDKGQPGQRSRYLIELLPKHA